MNEKITNNPDIKIIVKNPITKSTETPKIEVKKTDEPIVHVVSTEINPPITTNENLGRLEVASVFGLNFDEITMKQFQLDVIADWARPKTNEYEGITVQTVIGHLQSMLGIDTNVDKMYNYIRILDSIDADLKAADKLRRGF